MNVLGGRGHSGDLDMCGSIILKWIFRKIEFEVDWIQLVRDRDQ
jgi:hypothetical protein